jgi:hypothetical protein
MGTESEDIDAGWDEEPGSLPGAAAEASAPVPVESPSVQPPASWTDPPFEGFPLVTRRPGAYTSSESLSPAELAAPLPSTEPRSLTRFGPVMVLGALAAASVLWLGRAPKAEPPRASLAARPASGPVVPLPAEPVPSAAPRTAAPPSPVSADPLPRVPEPLQLEPLVLEAPDRVGVTVTVSSVPEGAVFFEAGQRLGAGELRLSIAPKAKRQLTALLNGYQPLNFKVDGTSDELRVELTPATRSPSPAARVAQ